MTDTRYSIINCSIEQVESVGGRNIQVARFSNIIFAELTEEQAEQLRQAGAIVELVPKIKADTIAPPEPVVSVPKYTPSELLEIAGLEELRYITDPPLYGQGINLAIVGAGILETHERIQGRVVYRKNYTPDPMNDSFDHDTGVASIAIAIAPQCGILNLKVIGSKGEGTEESVVMAVEECIALHEAQSEHAPSVLNLSLGAQDDGNVNSPMRIACRTAVEVGIWVFASCGNSGPHPYSITSPACEKYVFAIGSANYFPAERTFIVSGFSSRGPTVGGLTKPDAVLFGEDIIMASSASNTATTHKSGTSFTSPFAAGMAVLFLEGVAVKARKMVELGVLEQSMFYYVPVEEVMDQHLLRVCIKPSGIAIGKDHDYGYGLPFGPLITQALRPVSSAGTLMGVLPLVIMVPMMGIAMKTMTGGKQRAPMPAYY